MLSFFLIIKYQKLNVPMGRRYLAGNYYYYVVSLIHNYSITVSAVVCNASVMKKAFSIVPNVR